MQTNVRYTLNLINAKVSLHALREKLLLVYQSTNLARILKIDVAPRGNVRKLDQLPCVLRMGDVLFDFGLFVLSQKHDVYIQQLLCILSSDAALTHLGNGKVGSYMLQGHTDNKGSLGFNSILGLQRAISIYNRIKMLALDTGKWERGVETVLEQPTCEVCYKYEFAKAQYNDDEDIPLRRSTDGDNKHITERAVTRKRKTDCTPDKKRVYPRCKAHKGSVWAFCGKIEVKNGESVKKGNDKQL